MESLIRNQTQSVISSLCFFLGINGENEALQNRMDELTKEKSMFREELERRQCDLVKQIDGKKAMLKGQNEKFDNAVKKHAELMESKISIESQIEALTKEMKEREEYAQKLDEMLKNDNLNIDQTESQCTTKAQEVQQLLLELNGM